MKKISILLLPALLVWGCGWFRTSILTPSLELDKTEHSLLLTPGATKTFDITLTSSLSVNTIFQVTPSVAWLVASVDSASTGFNIPAKITITADATTLSDGTYIGYIDFIATGGTIENKRLTVTLTVGNYTPGSSRIETYRSDIDNSLQPYGIRLPSGYAGKGSYPLALRMHGYSGHANTSFSSAAITTADANGWILVNLEGRGNHFFDGAAETDLFDVIEHVNFIHGVDRSKIFLEGSSMGATGAYRHIARHPDIFAAAAGVDGWTDFNQWHRHYYGPASSDYGLPESRRNNLVHASPLFVAENILPNSLYLATDGLDSSVWAENGLKLNARLNSLGTSHTNVYNPSGGHGGLYNSTGQTAIYTFFENSAPLNLSPDEISISSYHIKTAKHAWLNVTSAVHGGKIELTATRNTTSKTISISSHNVRRFTISSMPLNPGAYTLSVNGNTLGSFTPPTEIELTIDATGEVTGGAAASPPPVKSKTSSLSGPIGTALTSRFVVAYGSSNPAYTASNLTDATEFCRAWADDWTAPLDTTGPYGFNAIITPVDEQDLTGEQIQNSNLVIFGSAESSTLINQMMTEVTLPFNLPVMVTESQIDFNGEQFDLADHGIWMIYPNPLAPQKLVVLGKNVVGIGGAQDKYGEILWTREAYTWQWPDYVIFDTDAIMGLERASSDFYTPDQWVRSGFFNNSWELDTATTEVSFVSPFDLTSFSTATLNFNVIVEVQDSLSTPVDGLSDTLFIFRIDGKNVTTPLLGTPSSGQYEFLIPISSLEVFASQDTDATETIYELSVEVTRPDGGAPILGKSNLRFFIN